jgi:Tfp pilus assembly protein PilO
MNSKLKGMWIKGILIIGVVSALLWVFLLSPRLATPAKLDAQQNVALQKNTTLQASIAFMNKRKADLPIAEQKVTALAVKFPSVADIPTLLAQINTAATKAGMNISQLSSVTAGKATLATGAGASGAAATVAEIGLAITAAGTYDQLIRFTNNLYATPRAITIDTVSLNAGTSIGGVATAGSYVVTIAGRSYLFSPIPPVPEGLLK